MSDRVELSELLPLMEEVLSSGGEFSFIPGGNSMRPMLYGRRDQVTIVKPQGRLKKYDLPLFRRPDGAFVLHRVVKVLPDSYVTRGDCTVTFERDITDSQIVGVVKSFVRKGKAYSVSSKEYRIYCAIWTAFPIFRRFIMHFGTRT